MMTFSTSYKLSACALAASMLISACGGGAESTDKVAPTVVISASALSSGVMTFSFVFSEDVGTSFAVEDLLITGGTPGVLTKTNGTTYSLPITPSGAAGTISVSLAASKYTDLANNPNTATASKSEAFDTTTGPGTPVLTFDELSGIALSAFSGGTLTIDAGPDSSVGKVGKLVRQGGDTAGGGKIVLNTKIPFTADSKKMTVRVWSSKANVPIILKVEGEAGAAVDAPAINVTAANTWQTMTFDFGAVDLSKNYNVVVLMPDTGVIGTGQVYYFDEITLVGASTGTPSTPTATAPTTAAATPVVSAANVLSIYSDAYAPIANVNLRPDWGQPTVVSEVLVAGNKTQKYTAFTYEGITFTPIDATAMTKLHIDVWTPDLTALDVYVLAGGAEQFVTVTPTKAGWNSFDIDLSAYTTLNKAAVKELKLVAKGGSTLYFDNLYFSTVASTAPTPSPTPTNLVTNGNFSGGATGWSGNAAQIRTEGGNSFNFATVAAAGNPWDVNLSYVLNIPTSGVAYKLRFKASSNGNRTLIAGIGLNQDPWTNVTQTVNLTSTTQQFELSLTSSFASPTSRVIFDMGAAVGDVVIDDVELVLDTAAPAPAPSPTPSGTPVAFSSGYTNPVAKGPAGGEYFEGATAEGGAWGYYSGGFPTAVGGAFTGGTADYRYIGTTNTAAPTAGVNGTYMGIYNLYKAGGLTTGGKAYVMVELAADADYIASGKQTLRIDVVGSEMFNNGTVADCVIVASGTVKPTSAVLTSYRVPITTFGQGCNQSSITNVAQVLSRPIGKVAITADWPNINNTVAHVGGADAGKYITAFTLGKIAFTD